MLVSSFGRYVLVFLFLFFWKGIGRKPDGGIVELGGSGQGVWSGGGEKSGRCGESGIWAGLGIVG